MALKYLAFRTSILDCTIRTCRVVVTGYLRYFRSSRNLRALFERKGSDREYLRCF